MKFDGEYSFLSNMYSCKICYDGKIFPCVETAFQYAKTHQVSLPQNWNINRMTVMYELLEEKFCHNKELRQALKNTGNLWIQEDNDWNDTFWGVCNGVGENMLGKMIMEIRQNIQDCDRNIRKVIVAGSRSFKDYNLMTEKLDYYFSNIEPVILCGEARGADTLGKKYAKEHNYSVESYPADWSKGKNAGYVRNEQMAKVADYAICFWDGKSAGTRHMIETMKKFGKQVRIVKYV